MYIMIDENKRGSLAPLVAWVKRQRLVARLGALDNRMLEDIGLERYQIAELAEQVFPRTGLKTFVSGLIKSITNHIRCGIAARRLAALDDRMLADIGITRDEIRRAAQGDLAFGTFAAPNIMSVSKAELVQSIPDLVSGSVPTPVNDDKRLIAA